MLLQLKHWHVLWLLVVITSIGNHECMSVLKLDFIRLLAEVSDIDVYKSTFALLLKCGIVDICESQLRNIQKSRILHI